MWRTTFKFTDDYTINYLVFNLSNIFNIFKKQNLEIMGQLYGKYKGSANYATYMIKTKFFNDPSSMKEFFEEGGRDISVLTIRLETYVENVLEEQSEGIAQIFAFDFAKKADYWEIAESMIEHYQEYHCDNCNEEIDDGGSFCGDKCKDEYWLLADHSKG